VVQSSQSGPAIARAVELLEETGTSEDLAVLRRVDGSRLGLVQSPGRSLARRLAPKAWVDDLGRLSIRLGDRVVSGGDIRRKVLCLLGFLLTRPQYCATREQIQEALWPELDPDAAANSLNQTCYFLRRVFEPGYTEKTTAAYLASKGSLVWLDADLVDSRSSECQRLLAELRRDPKPDVVARLAATYTARFGTDFLYDEWSASYRDSIHAAFLDRVARSLRQDLHIGAFERGIALAQQALMADPDADEIELLLLRLYRAIGANGAAAEQYAHYSTTMREQLGIEPPPLESL
jgi:LuxR family maltose regulon positive regulatory protein